MKKIILLTKEYKNNHKEEDKWIIINEIQFSEYTKENTIGSFNIKSYGEIKMSVYTKEGCIPHFHLEKSDKTFICCICLKENKYFHHKGIHDNDLSSKQKKELYNFLKSINKNTGLSYYETACLVWNSSEDNHFKIPNNITIPDYSKMKDSIHE